MSRGFQGYYQANLLFHLFFVLPRYNPIHYLRS